LKAVCTENLVRVEEVKESPKLTERSGYRVSFWELCPKGRNESL
jgi:hypothetical protein